MNGKRPTVSLLVGYYGFANDGDEWLLSQAKSLMKHIAPNSQFITRHRDQFRDDTGRSRSLIRSMMVADRVVFGGGTLFQNATSLGSLLYYVSLCLWARLFRKPVWLLGQGVGPIEGRLATALTRWAFRSAEVVSFRDDSAQVFANKTLTIHRPSTVDADLAFFRAEAADGFSMEAPLGISLRKGIGRSGVRELQRTLKAMDLSISPIVADHLEDPAVLEAVLPESSQQTLGDLRHTPTPFRGIVTMRYHVAVWASLNGIPFLALSKDPKLIAFASDMGQLVCPLGLLTMDEVLEKTLTQFLEQLPALNAELIKRVPQSIDRLSHLATTLTERVHAGH